MTDFNEELKVLAKAGDKRREEARKLLKQIDVKLAQLVIAQRHVKTVFVVGVIFGAIVLRLAQWFL